MGGKGSGRGSGGRRPGAGRPRSRLLVPIPVGIAKQLRAIAERERMPLVDVVVRALMRFIAEESPGSK